jgi:protein required for attachment to host cells
MAELLIPKDAWVFVGDGRKALFLRNRGTAFRPELAVETAFVDDNPPTHEQGSDRPGRAFSSVGNIRSGMDQTDWHDLEEHRFARKVAQALESLVRTRKANKIFIVAPARTLADLRAVLHRDVRKAIAAELAKDLTGHPVRDIARLLTAG